MRTEHNAQAAETKGATLALIGLVIFLIVLGTVIEQYL
jgi:Tfp pilus assembly protein PilW